MKMAKSYTLLNNLHTIMIIKIKFLCIINCKMIKKKTFYKMIIFKTPLYNKLEINNNRTYLI